MLIIFVVVFLFSCAAIVVWERRGMRPLSGG